MLLAENIQQRVSKLPNNLQSEIIDFIDFIECKYKAKICHINEKSDNFLDELIKNPRKVNSFKLYSREEIYDDR